MKNLNAAQKKVAVIKKQQDKGINVNGAKTNPFSGANPFGKGKNPFMKKAKFNL